MENNALKKMERTTPLEDYNYKAIKIENAGGNKCVVSS